MSANEKHTRKSLGETLLQAFHDLLKEKNVHTEIQTMEFFYTKHGCRAIALSWNLKFN